MHEPTQKRQRIPSCKRGIFRQKEDAARTDAECRINPLPEGDTMGLGGRLSTVGKKNIPGIEKTKKTYTYVLLSSPTANRRRRATLPGRHGQIPVHGRSSRDLLFILKHSW
ncbi:unnamed protein product [Ectocarpus sp. 13 AM-2016]